MNTKRVMKSLTVLALVLILANNGSMNALASGLNSTQGDIQNSILFLLPTNDDFNTPIVILSLPFTTTDNVGEATTAIDDPIFTACGYDEQKYHTVWFSFTPSENGLIYVDTHSSGYDTMLAVWTGSRGSLTSVACGDDSYDLHSQVQFNGTSGQVYYIEVASYVESPASPSLTIHLGLGAFQKISPAKGAANQPSSMSLTWSASVGATEYEYCYDKSDDDACDRPWTSAGTNTSAAITGLDTGSTYYWQVQSKRGSVARGADEDWGTFTISSSGNPATYPWQQYQYGAGHTGRSPYAGPDSPGLVWSFPLVGSPGSPAIDSDGTIYLSTGMLHEDTIGYLYAINPDGTQKWRTELEILPGSTSPAIGPDGTVYIHGSGTGGNTVAIEKMYAINPVDGSIKWTYLPNGNTGMLTSPVSSSPAVLGDGTIYIGSMNTTLQAIHPDGTLKWAVSPSSSSIDASPAVATDGTIYIVDSSTTLYAYSPSGTKLWSYKFAPGYGSNPQSPSIGPDGTVYIGGNLFNNALFAVNPDGTLKWSFATEEGVESTPAIGTDGTIYVGSDGVYAINPEGSQQWHYNLGFSETASPIIGSNGILYWDQYSLNNDGTLRWSGLPTTDSIGRDYAIGSDGTLYVPGTGYLYAYRNMPLPGTFSKSAPGNGAIDQATSLTLSWTASSGASSYEYCYDTSDDGVCSSWVNNGSLTSVPISGLTKGVTYYWHVRAKNLGGVRYANGDISAFWSFTTVPPNLPSAFGKSSPSNGATGQSTSVWMLWETSSAANYYEYCYDTSNDGACSTWNTSAGSPKYISGLSGDTTYYWQVRAVNGDGTTYANGSGSAFWSFTTLPAPPGAFGKSEPADDATNQPTTVTLSWSSSSGATSYEYCYDQTDNGICTPWISNGTLMSITLSGLEPAHTYYWHVRAKTSGGTTYSDASSSAFWSFTTYVPDPPTSFNKSTPANGSGQPTTLTLTWNPSEGATSYEYCYDDTNDNTCTWVSNGTTTSKQLSSLVVGKTYYWHVRAVNAGGTTYAGSGNTDFWSFTVIGPPQDFSKSNPSSPSWNVPTSLTLEWNPSSGATGYEYCVVDFGPPSCSNWISAGTDTAVAISGLQNFKTYYWQVRASNAGGIKLANSGSWWTFTTIPPAPGAFGKSEPVNGVTTTQSTSATIKWTASSGATGYEYCYATSTGNCTTWISDPSTSKFLSGLTPGTTYYWHLRAKNSYGTTYSDGASTAFWSFTTATSPPGAFNKSAPVNGAIDLSISPTLMWSASTGATSYEYCFDTTNDNACSSWSSNGASTSKALSGLKPATTYYWHIRAVNEGGTTYSNGAEIAFWSFKTKSRLIVRSAGSQDGWILESSENSNQGGALNSIATTFRLGDDKTKKQYLGILSFSTKGVPDNAVITKVTLKFKLQGIQGGGNPVTMFNGFMVDIKTGTFGTSALKTSDFQTAASKNYGPFTPILVSNWYSINLTSGKTYINKLSTSSGLTQIRLRFKLDDNNNAVANYLRLYSGNAPIASRPQLIIEYYVP